MEFDSRFWPWLLLLFVAPGLWLAVRLYGRPRRFGLAAAYALAWILIGLLAVSPRWRFRSETWHPPLVLLAVDSSGSYAALGTYTASGASVRAARAHYEALGFTVRETPYPLARDIASSPNLQAVLAWTDGRDPSESEERPAPAALFPVVVPPAQTEVQGERGVADSTTLTVEWRALGEALKSGATLPRAELVLVEGKTVLWKTTLVSPAESRWGERLSTRLELPTTVRARAQKVDPARDPARWHVLVRPESTQGVGGNRFTENDTLPLWVKGSNAPRRILIRPLATLEERALADALRAPASIEAPSGSSGERTGSAEAVPPGDPVVTAVEPSGLGGLLGNGAQSDQSASGVRRTVIWVRAGSSALEQVKAAAAPKDVPVVVYTPVTALSIAPSTALSTALPNITTRGEFGADARVAWRAEGASFLPAAVLRLADLGVGDAQALRNLRAPDTALEALAWAEQDGRRGLLFWRERDNGTFGCAVPPLWSAEFSSNVSKASGLSTPWLQGVSEWARDWGRDQARNASRRVAGASSVASSVASTRAGTRGTNELSRLGNDLEVLARLAVRGNGKVINISSNDIDKNSDKNRWPTLPGGQIRACSTRMIPLAPPIWTALAIASLLAIVWAMRKRLRFD